MNKVQKAVYDQIKLHTDYCASTLVMPILMYHHQIISSMAKQGIDSEETNKALRWLLDNGHIHAGRTINHHYVTLPQYVGRVEEKLKTTKHHDTSR